MDNRFVFKHPNIPTETLTVYDARKEPLHIYGLYQPQNEGLFRRMPAEVAEKVSKRVNLLHTNTAGARLRFVTDSPYIAVGAVYPPMEFPSARTAAFAAAGAFSFDLYADGKYCRILWPMEITQRGSVVSFDIPDGQYESFCELGEKKLREITLNFPSFVNISEVYIGLQRGSVLKAAPEYVNKKPVAFYGSSITQGGCASRPGNNYSGILSRKFDVDFVNLGFSGSARGETAIAEYVASLPMSAFVYAYDHNAPSVEHLAATHEAMYQIIRKAHPDIPVIMITRPKPYYNEEEIQRREVVLSTYRNALAHGERVYFVDGEHVSDILGGDGVTVDGCHPNDLGFACVAAAREPIFAEIYRE